MFAEPKRWNVEHVGLAEAADLVMVVPASANIIGKVCHGIADDFLTTMITGNKGTGSLCSGDECADVFKPDSAEKHRCLKEQGYHFVGPGSGNLACGTEGQRSFNRTFGHSSQSKKNCWSKKSPCWAKEFWLQPDRQENFEIRSVFN